MIEGTSKYNDFIKNYYPLKKITLPEKKQILNYFSNIKFEDQCLKLIEDFDNVILDINKKKSTNKKIKEIKSLTEEENDEKQDYNENNEEYNKKNKEFKETKIHKIIKTNKYSNEFIELFMKKNNKFTLDKIIDILDFLEKLMFLYIIKDIMKNYCSKDLDDKTKEIDEFYRHDKLLKKEYLTNAIRRYIIRYILREIKEEEKDKIDEDKKQNEINVDNEEYNKEESQDKKDNEKNEINNSENKIDTNKTIKQWKNSDMNITSNFYIEDLWDYEINKDENKNQKDEEIKKLKKMNITMGQLITLYDYLEGDKIIQEELQEIKNEEESKNYDKVNIEIEKEKEDINEDNLNNQDNIEQNNNIENENENENENEEDYIYGNYVNNEVDDDERY